MKIALKRFVTSRREGSAVVLILVFSGLLLLVLTGYLSMVKAQSNAIMRSQACNACIAIAEAGLEEALTHTRFHYKTGLETNGWQLVGGEYRMTRNLGSNYFQARISST